MGREDTITAITHEYLPDARSACSLVRKISGKEPRCGPRKIAKPLILYGAGNLGRLAANYFKHIGFNVHCVVDANAANYQKDVFWQGVPVISPEDAQAKDKAGSILAICVSTAPLAPIIKFLSQQGWQDVVPFYDIAEAYRDLHPLSNGWFAKGFHPAEISGVEWVLERWGDDISRAHHIQFLAWRALREEWTFDAAPVTIDDRYFVEPVVKSLNDHECFIDIGAHHGEVSTKFANLVKGKFNSIYAIEPDQENLLILRKNFDRQFRNKNNVHIMDSVLGDKVCPSSIYSGLDYATQICEFGNKRVNIETIDKLSLSPTILKLHIEGGELGAFVGGLQKIIDTRPIIMATIYHNELGVYRFPKLLMKCLDDYRFILRLHGWCGTGLVLYALPKERN